MFSDQRTGRRQATEGHLLVGGARLYYRHIGSGQPIVVLHGGPDFDQNYLLPEMDRLADRFRLIYYDQRGRGRSGDGVKPEEVGIRSEVEDLESLRSHFRLDKVALLGHSWGGVLAMEYAIRHPDRVSQLVLMNTAPASHTDRLLLSRYWGEVRSVADVEAMADLASTARYRRGDLEAEAEYYRHHFAAALPRSEHLELIIPRLRANFTEKGVRKARAIENRLYEQTWSSPDYDLLPALGELDIPTLVLHGESDFVPVEASVHIAEAMPSGRLVVLSGCGHFAYLETPELVHSHIGALLASS